MPEPRSLLGKSCQGTLKLAGHPIELQEQGYLFGKHLALAWQACLDREPFLPGTSGPFSLICAPLMFTLQHDPTLYQEIERGQETVDDVDYETIRKSKEHSTAALEVLNQLPTSDARTALANIIAAMQDLGRGEELTIRTRSKRERNWKSLSRRRLFMGKLGAGSARMEPSHWSANERAEYPEQSGTRTSPGVTTNRTR
ncbi:hypothetical protein GEV33_006504 [Tenebrio molitor]|uniref:Uncharacterized protein n=1 Tax=Tenebrio molitor TaxID=7067 RepID=A0A8J6HL07_TENMO|nr:hypothetical protein GEV33_006504 [Tenebrio molitor]